MRQTFALRKSFDLSDADIGAHHVMSSELRYSEAVA
jgi:hypothetical protein